VEWGNFDPEYFNLEDVNVYLGHPRPSIIEGEEGYYEPPKLDVRNLNCITAWSQELKKEQQVFVELLAIQRDMVTLLNYFKEKRPLGTQSTGKGYVAL
jgi:hypothetical protein